ncbi:MAG: T9SS type A sorting domain-containing protein [Candidatus Delongbacteria bacterium]|nr:T9SS type A sorting domain-containing protein [Candidatus Delongbacteria bacterium]
MKARITIFITLVASFILLARADMITWENDYALEFGDGINSIEPTSDGGYIAGGWYYQQLSIDVYQIHARLIKIDSYGNMEWERAFMLADIAMSGIKSIIENSDGDFIATGFSEVAGRSDAVMVLKYDKDGNFIWSKFYGNLNNTQGNVIKETEDKGYIIAGREAINDSINAASIIRLDSNCDSLWTVTNNIGINSEYRSLMIDQNDFVAVGYSQDETYDYDGLVMKVDSLGSKVWEKYNEISLGASCIDYEGNYICAWGFGFYKYNQFGDTLYSKEFGSDLITGIKSLMKVNDGNYICAGQVDTPDEYGTNYDWCIIKFDQNLDTLWKQVYGHKTRTSDDYLWGGCKPTTDGGYIAGGNIYHYSYAMKLDENGTVGIMDNGQLIIDNYSLEQNYPNPFNNQTTITYKLQNMCEVDVSIYNSNGQFVQNLVNKRQAKGNYGITFNGSKLNSGVYYYRLKIDVEVKDTKKMIYLR